MTYKAFEAFLKRLNEYYGLSRNITVERCNMWFGVIKHIPDEAIPSIESFFHENWNTLPANVPRQMRLAHLAWKSANAQKYIDYPYTRCPQCHDHGLIWINRAAKVNGEVITCKDGVLLETVSFRCADCENWKRHCHDEAKPAAHRKDLLDQGFEIV